MGFSLEEEKLAMPSVEHCLTEEGVRPPGPPDLDLSYNELTGSIPAEIGALIHLQHFGFSSNQLSGHVPPELVTSLQGANLDLSDNDFLFLEGVSKPERWRMEGCGLRAPPAKRPRAWE